MKIIRILAIVLLVTGIGVFVVGTEKPHSDDQPTLLRSGFEYVNGQGYFAGVIQNSTDRPFSYVHAELAFTDKSRRILSTTIERLCDMEPGAMRRFEVQLPSGASGARLLRVVAY